MHRKSTVLAISRYPDPPRTSDSKSTIGSTTCMTRAPVDLAVTRIQIKLGALKKSVVSYYGQSVPSFF